MSILYVTRIVRILQVWSKMKLLDDVRPTGTSHHAAACLGYGSQWPQVLIIGGQNQFSNIDLWILNVNLKHWKMVSLKF